MAWLPRWWELSSSATVVVSTLCEGVLVDSSAVEVEFTADGSPTVGNSSENIPRMCMPHSSGTNFLDHWWHW